MNDVPISANDSRILDQSHNRIQFVCKSLSPCGDPKIPIGEEPHFNFLVRVTNKYGAVHETQLYVDGNLLFRGLLAPNSYCVHEVEFVIRLRGAEPNPYTVSIPVFLVTLLMLFLLCALYVLVYFWRLRIAAAYQAYHEKIAGK